MNLRAISRTAIGGYLRLIRLPLDGAVALLPGNGTGPRPAARLALDRADATARLLTGALLADPGLRDDARRRRTATEERTRALRLRGKAERTARAAGNRLEERRDQAAQRRAQGDRRAKAKREDVKRRRQATAQRATDVEDRRRKTSRSAHQESEQAIDEQAPRDRLEALDAKAKALREREKELTARDEARRLRASAGQAKAERKRR